MSGPSTDGAARPACSNAIVWCLWPTNPQNKSSGGFRTQSVALTSAHNFISRRHDDLECSWGFRPDQSIQARFSVLIRRTVDDFRLARDSGSIGGDDNATSSWFHNRTSKELVSPMGGLI